MEISELNQFIYLSLQKDEKAFRRLVCEYQSRIFSICFRMLNNEEDAKDAVQETFLKVWLNLYKYNQDQIFLSWVYKIACNQCLDQLRKNKKIFHLTIDENKLIQILSDEDSEKQLLQNELGQIIHMISEKMSPKVKLVFILSEIEDLDVSEIVKITGLTPAKIKSNLYLARKQVKVKLKQYMR